MPNDFSGDGSCKALFRFESGALTADSKGSNTLTSHGSPVADTGDYREGAACVDLEAGTSDYFSISDAALDAGFPLKSGDTNKLISVCFWIKAESGSTTRYVIAKYDTNNRRTLGIMHNSGILTIFWGHSGGIAFETLSSGFALASGGWYYIGIVIDGIAKSCYVAVYRVSTGTFDDILLAASNELNVEDADFTIGARHDGTYNYDGRLDEVVVFNRLLSTIEIDQIRRGVFGSESANQVHISSLGIQTAYGDEPLAKIGGGGLSVAYSLSENPSAIYTGSLGFNIAYSEEGEGPMLKRKFPIPPAERLLQSQPGKRKFPVVT